MTLAEQEARERALDLAVVLGIHEQSTAFDALVAELLVSYRRREALRRVALMVGDRLHLGPTSLGQLRTILAEGDPLDAALDRVRALTASMRSSVLSEVRRYADRIDAALDGTEADRG